MQGQHAQRVIFGLPRSDLLVLSTSPACRRGPCRFRRSERCGKETVNASAGRHGQDVDAHVVATDDVETEGHLFHGFVHREDAFKGFGQNDVGRLIETFEFALPVANNQRPWALRSSEAPTRIVRPSWVTTKTCLSCVAKSDELGDISHSCTATHDIVG